MTYDPKAKLCKDCKWCQWDGTEANALHAICLNIKCNPDMDVVTGKPLWKRQSCNAMRALLAACDWQAKHFEPK
jgi:hypothetical protein